MLDRWFGPKIHHYLHIVGMMVLAFGMPFNKVLMSIGSIWGVSNLILEADFANYFKRIKSNKAYLFLLGFFLLHIVALLWTENLDYAWHDLRIKLPLLAVPLALVAHPIVDRKEIQVLLLTFLSSILMISLINGYHYVQMTEIEIGKNFRDISIFGSHIRFSILIVLGAILSGYFFFVLKKWRWFFVALFIWFLSYTYFSQVLSGLLSLIAAALFLLFYWAWPKKFLRYLFLGLATFVIVGIVYSVNNIKLNHEYNFSKLEVFSPRGNLYFHDSLHPSFENGKPVYVYISYDELEAEWDSYFSISYHGKDKKNNPIQSTLYRYMTALDLRKDHDGLKKLSQQDIKNIENGIATPEHLKKGFSGRLESIKYAVENQGDPNNSTVLQRLEYWKTALQIIRKNPVLGVGTGDVQDAFDAQYQLNRSKLIAENRHRTHNMFLTIQLSFGIFGTILFFLFIRQFLLFNYSNKNILAFCIFGAIIASLFVEDTLETQTGVTLFSFFISLFLLKWELGTKRNSKPNKFLS
jgi:O-Antigen ligase